jgi:hypothetical protein
MSFTSISWVWDESEKVRDCPPIVIERCKQLDGTCKYAVRQAGACLSVNGEWVHEPIHSSRDDDFLRECRFKTWDGAAHAIIKFCQPCGRFQGQFDSLREVKT